MPLTTSNIDRLKGIVGVSNILSQKEDLIPYAFDGTAALLQMPRCVVFAEKVEQIVAILELAHEQAFPVVTRGSGTGLSGGSLPIQDGLVLCTVKMDRILEIDRANLTMLVELRRDHPFDCRGSQQGESFLSARPWLHEDFDNRRQRGREFRRASRA